MLARVALVVLSLLAGCASPQPAQDVADDDGARRTSGVEGDAPLDDRECERRGNTTVVCTYWGEEIARVWMAGAYRGTGNGHVLNVTNGTVAIDAVLTWTSPGNVQDLDLAVSFPGCVVYGVGASTCLSGGIVNELTPGLQVVDGDGLPGMPDSPARLQLDEEAIDARRACVLPPGYGANAPNACRWWVMVQWSEQVTAQVAWELVVTLTLRDQGRAEG